MNGRGLLLVMLTGALLLAAAQGATAAQSDSTQSDSTRADAAWRAANTPDLRAVLVRFFAQEPDAPRSAAPVSVRVLDDPVPVYELSAAFVAGVPGAAPGDFAYYAVPVRASDGRAATVWSVPGNSGWEVGNIASGDLETAFAKALPAGAQLLHEPQIDAWYAVRDGQIARLGVAATPVTLAEYQHAVAARYADKLPGSKYAQNGEAGGYGTANQVMPRGDGGPTPESSRVHGLIPFLVFGSLLVIAGLGYALRLRRRTSVPTLTASPSRGRIDARPPAGPA